MWLSKIFFGILYREHLLLANRKVGKRTIIPKKALQELRLHHDFMQGIRRSLEFPSGIPGSILIFGTSVPNAQHTFLATERSYGDFILEYEFQVDTDLSMFWGGYLYNWSDKNEYVPELAER